MRKASGMIVVLLAASPAAWAGHGSSSVALQAAVQSGSVDAIVGELERAEVLPSPGAIDVVLPLIDHASYRVRDRVGWWLGKRGVRDQVIASLTARLSASDPIAARNAGDVLAGMRDPTALPALTQYLAHPLDEDSGVAAARAVGAIGHPSGVAALAQGLVSSLAGVRAAAAANLRLVRAPRGQKTAAAAPQMLSLVSDGDAGVRREAVLTIGFIAQSGGDVTGALAELSRLATSDPSASVRKAAAWGLGELKDGGARAALVQAQSDADPFVRSIATAALANLR